MVDIQRTSRRQFINQTRSRAIGIDANDGSQKTELLSALSKFATAASGEAGRQQQVEIETKKALGASRAAQDLLKAEQNREGLTEDDVNATKVSYNAIVGQHDTMNAGNKFAEWYSQNPSADTQQIEDKKSELYQPVLDKYSSDPASLKQVSLQVQESQFNLLAVESGIKGKYTKQKSQEALVISVNDLMATPDADMDAIVNSEIPTRAKSLGLTEFEYKKAMMQAASTRAAEGDARLLNKLSTEDWAKDSAALKKAQSDYDRYVAYTESPAVGDKVADIEIEMNTLTVPWETTLRKAEALNDEFPTNKPFSAAKITSMKKARAASLSKMQSTTSGMKDSLAFLRGDHKDPLAHNKSYTPAEKKHIITDLEKSWVDKRNAMVDAGGVTSDDAAKVVLKEQLDWSRYNRMQLPSIKLGLDSMMNLSVDEITHGGSLPQYAQEGMHMLQNMDSTAIELYLPSGADKTFALNFKKFSMNMDIEPAYRRADTIKRNPYKVSPTQRTEQSETTMTTVDERLTNTIWETFSTKDVQLDVPEWQRAQLSNRWDSDAQNLMTGGGFDSESNANYVIDTNLARMSQMFNGTLVNQSLPDLHTNISNGRTMPISKTQDYVESFMLASKKPLEAAYGTGLDTDNLTMDFNRDGSSFTIIDANGEQIGGRFLTKDIYPIGRDADLENLRSLNVSKEAQAEREERAAEDARVLENLELGIIPFKY